ncbi:MAG: 8-amino-7-oxononanoate synthase [Aquabacterium sp.]|jgi:8-amino-7-oxononanoate synthase|nr:MAG: 8-amino-7-oxononanoate synthase [Aquabacterium sp.]
MLLDDLSKDLGALRDAHLLRARRIVEPLPPGSPRAGHPAWIRMRETGADGIERVRDLLSFAGNDYLGLSRHPALVEAAREAAARYGVGSTASPSVCGHWEPHEQLERELAAFVGLPRATLFHSGYAANTGVIPALVERGDAVISDSLNHACLIDGARLSRAEVRIVPHLDLAALDAELRATAGARRRLVIADAVFSMDGDIAPIGEMLDLCERHDAWLMVDDAHGFGVLGEAGRGTHVHLGLAGRLSRGAQQRFIYMATLGKAAGVAGAFVAGVAPLVDWLVQRARTYMFATAAPPAQAQALRAALRVIAEEGWRRERLEQLRTLLRSGLLRQAATLLPSPTAIQPLIVGESAAAVDLMSRLLDVGLWAPAIRPPTVPAGTARLRISLSAAHEAADVQRLVNAIAAPHDAEASAA